ncbi:MAG TPA: alkaline phosphatase family protein [Ktedonobacteraceae bacterium]|nr:alkaline phosphatase family protein [Ktedonobacteraceae bacterium]
MGRVLVIGLDALSPELVNKWLPDLPNLRALMERGIHGPLQSIVQPVTPAAWTAMLSGRDPGHFGFTDFMSRTGNSYLDFRMVHSRMITVQTLYTLLPQAGRRVMMVGVPITYPPVPISDGVCVSCFMAPSLKKPIVFPPALQAQLLAQTSSPYILDASVDGAEEVDLDSLLWRIKEMDRQRFDMTGYLMQTHPWDLLFMVAMGTDRVGHYFMRFLDPDHCQYVPNSRYCDAIREHYRYCDKRLGELMQVAGPDTVIMVVSDHGMQRLDGKVNINDWLIENNYLYLNEAVDRPTPLSKAAVDWSRTRAWARGFGGQIYLNIRGREAEGCVEPGDAEALMKELIHNFEQVSSLRGYPVRIHAIRRDDIYSGPQAARCPDLFIQINDLHYLTSDLVGHDQLLTPLSAKDLDNGSHAPYGFFAMAGPGVQALGHFAALHLLDVAPTILDLLQVPVPADLVGHPIHLADDVYSEDEEEELVNRLRTLYLE